MSRADRCCRYFRFSAYRVVVLSVVAMLAACTANPAPNRWLPTPMTAASDPWGAYIVVTLRDTITRKDTVMVRGEFLAVDRDTVFVLPMDSIVRRVPVRGVAKAQVAWYDSEMEKLGWWTLLGTVSSLSHGFGLVFTMPLWIISGTASAASESRAPLLDVTRVGWDSVRPYARYPAGVPAALPERLQSRPLYTRPKPMP
jgi:hypothetical protein